MSREHMMEKLAQQQAVLASLSEMMQGLADLAKKADASGLAFATLMVRESLEVYASEVARFVTRVADEQD